MLPRPLAASLIVAMPVLIGVGFALAAAVDLIDFGAGTAGREGPRFDRIARVVTERTVWRGTAWSLWVASASTALATGGAMLLALVFRGSARATALARMVVLIPLPVPHVVAGVVALIVLGQSGLAARAGHALGLVDAPAAMLPLVYDPLGSGVILALVWKEIPFLSLIAFSVLAARGGALEETARTLGASPAATIRRVTLPILWRGMLPAVVAVFTFAFGSFEIVALLAPSDPLALPLLISERYTEPALDRRADAFVLALVAIGIAVLAVAMHEWLRGGWDRLEA